MTPLLSGGGVPGARLDPTGTAWIIDPAKLDADTRSRQTQHAGAPVGPYLPRPDRVGALLPLLTFALETPLPAELDQLLKGLIESVLGPTYAQDAILAGKHWPRGRAPDVDTLLAMAHSAHPGELAIYADVIAYYRYHAVLNLLARAFDFGFAKFLGLGIDDVLPAGTAIGSVHYILDVVLAATPTTPPVMTIVDPQQPRPPRLLAPRLAEGGQGYEDFAPFYQPARRWRVSRPAIGWTPDLESLASSAEVGPRRASPIVSLTWFPPEHGEPTRGILTYEPVLWRVERAGFGPASAHDATPPPLGPGARFTVCPDGDRVRLAAPGAPFLDDAGPRWGERPMEGWYAYRVSAIDIFGISGGPCPPATIRLRDETGPPPPVPTLSQTAPPDGMRVEIPIGASRVSVPLILEWGWVQERIGPDALEFRIRYQLRTIDFLRVNVVEVRPAAGALDTVRCVVRLADEAGTPFPSARLATLVGKVLVTGTTEHPIVAVHPGAPSAVEVRRSVGRPPPRGTAAVRASGDPTPEVLQREPRRPARAAKVEVASITPLRVRLRDPSTGTAITPSDSGVYLHLFGAGFRASPRPPSEFALDESHVTGPVAQALAAWRALSPPDASAVLTGSPAVLLPVHLVNVDVAVPATLDAGLLEIEVSAADGVDYEGTIDLPGNEGSANRLLVTLARLDPPVAPPGPVRKTWARGAAEYLNTAVAPLTWPAVPRAARYEIERALESALGLASHASDNDLIAIARTAAAETAFERCANPAMGPTCEDALPGRVPTRVIYRVRAVTASEIRGAWSIVALVRVPDVRVPPPPNLISVRPPEPLVERALDLQWTQGGTLRGIGFLVETRRQGRTAPTQRDWTPVAEFLPGMLAPEGDNRFRARINGLPTGPRLDLRVSAVRHALDPIDPLARLTRRIVGYPSAPLAAVALGALRPPRDLTAVAQGGTAVNLRWTNAEDYEALEVRRRPPGAWGFRRQQVAHNAETFSETLDRPGLWTYQLLAIGVGCSARSVEIDIDVRAGP
jgi:hypothetical protein